MRYLPGKKLKQHAHSNINEQLFFFKTQNVLTWHHLVSRLPALSFVLLDLAHLLRCFSSGRDQELFTTFTIKDLHSEVGRQLHPRCLFFFFFFWSSTKLILRENRTPSFYGKIWEESASLVTFLLDGWFNDRCMIHRRAGGTLASTKKKQLTH